MISNIALPSLDELQIAERMSLFYTGLQSTVAPLWPLKDYVAVNPFVGLTGLRFLSARKRIVQVRDGDLLLPMSHYRRMICEDRLSENDLATAWDQCCTEYPEEYSKRSLKEFLDLITWYSIEPKPSAIERQYWTFAEILDHAHDTTWSDSIVNAISRHCAAHLDEGQAIWPSPWRHLSLYGAWREANKIDRRIEQQGLTGFRELVAELPDSPREAIELMLEVFRVPWHHRESFLLCQLWSIPGWASYLMYREGASDGDIGSDDLMGLLAIRLAYDYALTRLPYPECISECWPGVSAADLDPEVLTDLSDEVLARYLCQVALEVSYRSDLSRSLVDQTEETTVTSANAPFQMVFCIDVRSEVIRRHLEAVSCDIQTLGFAGFFGLPMEYVALGEETSRNQLPVLLRPKFCLHETLKEGSLIEKQQAIRAKQRARLHQKIWKSFQTSAASCFTFVESTGVWYAVDLVRRTLGWDAHCKNPNNKASMKTPRQRLVPLLPTDEASTWPPEQQIETAHAILRNMGLTRDFGRLVALCGHASQTVNNPYRAGLDCGACGGHSGEINARVAAALLNAPHVRKGLAQREVLIPETTYFVAAVHNTTADVIEFFDVDGFPAQARKDLEQLSKYVAKASELTRTERSARLGADNTKELLRKCRDWSEVRPEWGLAGNAAMIIAPRRRTYGLSLEGRTFLHNYEFGEDEDLKVLELILTAPMVVANWINLQYYASAVDNNAYGSGNKVLHNVVGLMGILEGNGGDLKGGLPWQSLHDGYEYQHEPLRLSVLIEAPREAVESVIERHALLQELIDNGWLTVMVFADGQFEPLRTSHAEVGG